MAKQIVIVEGSALDLDRIVYISPSGHIALDVYMTFQQLKDVSNLEAIVQLWIDWKDYKFRMTVGMK
ncbi:MAG: hypothetical protein DRJ64_02865 [Thermoprotei archaeon]|nr:MAG: hypothetical protein DRJ64_02865 [Thermoprotei archaeon]